MTTDSSKKIDIDKIEVINGIIETVSLHVIPHFSDEIFLNFGIKTENVYYRIFGDVPMTGRIGDVLKSVFQVVAKTSHASEDGVDLMKFLQGKAVRVLTADGEIVGIQNIITQDFYMFK